MDGVHNGKECKVGALESKVSGSEDATFSWVTYERTGMCSGLIQSMY